MQALRATKAGGILLRMTRRKALWGKLKIQLHLKTQNNGKFGTWLEPGTSASQFCLSSYSTGTHMAEQSFNEHLAVVQYASIPGNYVSQS